MNFVSKPYQRKIIDHIVRTPRCNVFASPGTGKTVSTLTALDALALADDVFPALVVAPLRVARSVWSTEITKWAHLNGLRVAHVLGNPLQRERALSTVADIYTIHYGLLEWLAYSSPRWPFRTVIADESSKLKHHRCSYRTSPLTGKPAFYSAGSANAAALASRAKATTRWVNLTGTPAANGLKDLWGQHWFVDFGEALGRTFTAFQQRWFYSTGSREASVLKPFDHAESEITSRIRPTTISINAYDWFDCERPREVTLEVTLPKPIMAQYKELHREATLKLENATQITAINAAGVTNKCIQFASGNLLDKDGVAHHIHNEKLDALEDLLEELNGEPLLVAYQFIHDKDAILKRFKQAKVLPTGAGQKAVEDEWNAGKIPMLVVHPLSAGHGLNLQWGGCNVCIYTPDWNLESYEQVIERVGPVRQMQAGLNRIVTVYHIVAKDTFDKVVCARRLNKATVQQAVLDAVRESA